MCQRDLWPMHIFECNRTKPIPPAYYLYKSAMVDSFPDDQQTLQGYNFLKMGG
jgi:hypothetical protein